MKNRLPIVAGALLAAAFSLLHTGAQASTNRLKVEVVFCLDATSSMSGLIAAAKEKILTIASSIAASDSAPDIRMGMVYYRDRTDAFITKVSPLTVQMDALYAELRSVQAQGGGDFPESVNAALAAAVNDMRWSQDTTVLKYIFLVGDAPPHMDYQETKYPEICKTAKKKDIIINTILMGGRAETRPVWKEIAAATGGEFLEANMKAKNFEVHSPFDSEIKNLSEKLDKKRYYCGTPEGKAAGLTKDAEAREMLSISAAESARRADFNMMNATNTANYYGSSELLNMVSTKGVKVSELKESELPPELAKVEKDKREEWVKAELAQRDSIQKKLAVLLAEREKHIDAELDKMKKEDVSESFNARVYDVINSSASRKGYKMRARAKF